MMEIFSLDEHDQNKIWLVVNDAHFKNEPLMMFFKGEDIYIVATYKPKTFDELCVYVFERAYIKYRIDWKTHHRMNAEKDTLIAKDRILNIFKKDAQLMSSLGFTYSNDANWKFGNLNVRIRRQYDGMDDLVGECLVNVGMMNEFGFWIPKQVSAFDNLNTALKNLPFECLKDEVRDWIVSLA